MHLLSFYLCHKNLKERIPFKFKNSARLTASAILLRQISLILDKLAFKKPIVLCEGCLQPGS